MTIELEPASEARTCLENVIGLSVGIPHVEVAVNKFEENSRRDSDPWGIHVRGLNASAQRRNMISAGRIVSARSGRRFHVLRRSSVVTSRILLTRLVQTIRRLPPLALPLGRDRAVCRHFHRLSRVFRPVRYGESLPQVPGRWLPR